jgi:hypothetical protein
MNATPSTHPEAAALQSRLAPVLAAASEERDVRSLIELLGDHRGIGWVTGEERVGYVQRLHDALHGGGLWSAPLRRKIRKITYDDLLGAFGAGPWEPT